MSDPDQPRDDRPERATPGEDRPDRTGGPPPETDVDDPENPPEDTVEDLIEDLEELESVVDTGAERRQVREAMRTARRLRPGTFGRVVRGFDRADLAEALLGSVLFGVPMAVEGGTVDAGRFVGTRPPLLVGTVLFGVGLVVGILYVAEIQDVRVHEPILGVIPRRLAAVVGVSAAMAAVLLTGWGLVDWSAPRVALGSVAVAFVPMAVGAALGDILPGS